MIHWGGNALLTVKEVRTKKENKQFITFPDRLYAASPYYVPSFKGDEYSDWDPKKNPAFSYSEVKRFLAFKDGELVGRIGAILSHRANEKWGENRMRFTAVDFVDDKEVSAALFGAVEAFAKEKGCEALHGPLGFTDLDREGMLIEGFESPSLFYTYYNAPYYREHLEALGYCKSVDWVEIRITRPEGNDRSLSMLSRLAARVAKKHELTVFHAKRNRDFKPYIEQAFSLVNLAYGKLYGTVQLDEVQIRRYAAKFVPLVDPDFAGVILDKNGKMIAFGAAVPDLSKAIRKTQGKLFPFGWITTLKALKRGDGLNLLLIAVHPDWQGKGVNAMIIDHVFSGAWRRGTQYAETGPQLEDNADVISQWSIFPHEQHKRRRCFIKHL